MKRYNLTIPSNASGGRLMPYLLRALPQVPSFAVREAFKKRDVKVNGERVGSDASILPGAEVVVYVRDVPSLDIPVLYRDENVMVVIKPAGISCEADGHGGKTLTAMLHEQLLRTDPAEKEPLLCHRLDNPTEGLLLLAMTDEAQQRLQDAFRSRQVHKAYICLVRGTPSPAHQVLSAWLVKDARRARVHVTGRQTPAAKPIVTEYTVMQGGPCSRLLIRLHTGRTHQIRAHMAFLGHPLLGDDQYGDRAFNRQYKARRLMLCACELSFSLEGPLSYLNDRRFSIQPSF